MELHIRALSAIERNDMAEIRNLLLIVQHRAVSVGVCSPGIDRAVRRAEAIAERERRIAQ